jgi:hypothetical protein
MTMRQAAAEYKSKIQSFVGDNLRVGRDRYKNRHFD